MKGLEDYEYDVFVFAEVFICQVVNGKVMIEQFEDKAYELPHIKTEAQYLELKRVLTGESE